ncbi:hypothetical protein [Rhodococcus opacus]|uniref:hypothetical protein n=1 Tax=Rhodococcus opacus TaxID=37919 RepID=UPI00155A8B21|nr:hypothetical protein [Rhodococcus opacus]
MRTARDADGRGTALSVVSSMRFTHGAQFRSSATGRVRAASENGPTATFPSASRQETELRVGGRGEPLLWASSATMGWSRRPPPHRLDVFDASAESARKPSARSIEKCVSRQDG